MIIILSIVRTNLLVRVLLSAFLIAGGVASIFPQVLLSLGIPQFFSFTWETTLLRYLVVIITSFVLILLWKKDRYLIQILLIALAFSLFKILTTPEFAGGGWIYSAPGKEETIEYSIRLYAALYAVAVVWRWFQTTIINIFKIKVVLGRRSYIILSLPVIFLCSFILLMMTDVGEIYHFPIIPFFSSHVLVWWSLTFFIMFYFMVLCFLRIHDTRLSRSWFLLSAAPLGLLFLDAHFGQIFFFLLSPFVYAGIVIFFSKFPTRSAL